MDWIAAAPAVLFFFYWPYVIGSPFDHAEMLFDPLFVVQSNLGNLNECDRYVQLTTKCDRQADWSPTRLQSNMQRGLREPVSLSMASSFGEDALYQHKAYLWRKYDELDNVTRISQYVYVRNANINEAPDAEYAGRSENEATAIGFDIMSY